MSARGYTVVPNILVRDPEAIAAANLKPREVLVDLDGRPVTLRVGEWLVYQEILRRSYNGTHLCTASYKTLGLAAGCKGRQAGDHARKLVEVGMVELVKRRRDHLELRPLVTAEKDGLVRYELSTDVHPTAGHDVHPAAYKEGTTGKEDSNNSSTKEAARSEAAQRRARGASVGGVARPRPVIAPLVAAGIAAAEAEAAAGEVRVKSASERAPLGTLTPYQARRGRRRQRDRSATGRVDTGLAANARDELSDLEPTPHRRTSSQPVDLGVEERAGSARAPAIYDPAGDFA